MEQRTIRRIVEEGSRASLEVGAVSMAVGFHLEALFISVLVLAGSFLYIKSNQNDLISIVGGRE